MSVCHDVGGWLSRFGLGGNSLYCLKFLSFSWNWFFIPSQAETTRCNFFLPTMPFINYQDVQWETMLTESDYDLYHLPGFASLEADLLGGKAIGWYHVSGDEKYLMPLIQREIGSAGRYDLVSPYGYPGLLYNRITNPINDQKASQVLNLFEQEAREAGYVSSFIRLNPLWNAWKVVEGERTLNDHVRQWFHGGTISVDLRASETAIKDSFSENHRRNLRRLHSLGFTAQVNKWESIDGFVAAYRQTMKRRMAHPYYFFPDDYFRKLRDMLGDKLLYVSVCDADGRFSSGGLFTLFNPVMQYHLGATLTDQLYLSPSKLMMDAAIAYGKLNNARTLHLGGGLGGSTTDGLFRFKKGFGRLYHPYSTLRFVHDPKRYDELKRQGKFQNTPAEYFPEYR